MILNEYESNILREIYSKKKDIDISKLIKSDKVRENIKNSFIRNFKDLYYETQLNDINTDITDLIIYLWETDKNNLEE